MCHNLLLAPRAAFIVAFIATSVRSQGATHIKLINSLLAEYDKNHKPVYNQSESIVVYVRSMLYSILEVDETEETVTYAHWTSLKWKDELLTWNPNDYSGIDAITLRKDKVWMPDIAIYEGTWHEQSVGDTFVTVFSDGTVAWSAPEIIKVRCHFDVSQFPFDTQNCSSTYASWVYPASDLVLKPLSVKEDIFQNHSEWQLLDVEVVQRGVIYYNVLRAKHLTWNEVSYYMIIRRRPLYYIVSLVIPVYTIAQVTIVAMFTPRNAQCVSRVELGITGMLSMSVMLLVVSGFTPHSATSYPLLGKYMLLELLIIGLASMCSTLVLNIHSRATLGQEPVKCLLSIVRRNKVVSSKMGRADAGNWSNKDELWHAIYEKIRQYIMAKEAHKDHCKMWTKICLKLNNYSIVALLLINTVVLILFLLSNN